MLGLLIIITVLYSIYILRNKQNQKFEQKVKEKNVLLVIAHPDDECMFFSPLLASLQRSSARVYVLCLSTGNYRNEGNLRQIELLRSTAVFGIDQNNVYSIHHPQMLDDPDTLWDSTVVAEAIDNIVKQNNINLIFSFDSFGVSGHKNHISVFNGLKHLMNNVNQSSSNLMNALEVVEAYELQTVNVIRKYSGILDVFSTTFIQAVQQTLGINKENEFLLISDLQQVMIGNQAMHQHQSQLVWFRRLYLLFSRYMYLNTFKKISN